MRFCKPGCQSVVNTDDDKCVKELLSLGYVRIIADAILPSHCHFCSTNGDWVLDLAMRENLWVSSVMPSVDLNIKYHDDGDVDRMTSTESAWKLYRVALRNYVKDGVVTQPSRPVRPV